jgi:hypothetical protein
MRCCTHIGNDSPADQAAADVILDAKRQAFIAGAATPPLGQRLMAMMINAAVKYTSGSFVLFRREARDTNKVAHVGRRSESRLPEAPREALLVAPLSVEPAFAGAATLICVGSRGSVSPSYCNLSS